MDALILPKGRGKLRTYHLTPVECATIYQFIRAGHDPRDVAAVFEVDPVSVRRAANRLSDGEKLFVTRYKNEVGNRYGILTVTALSHHDRGAWFKCQCQCGRTITVRGYQLRQGKTKSCGCIFPRQWHEQRKRA